MSECSPTTFDKLAAIHDSCGTSVKVRPWWYLFHPHKWLWVEKRSPSEYVAFAASDKTSHHPFTGSCLAVTYSPAGAVCWQRSILSMWLIRDRDAQVGAESKVEKMIDIAYGRLPNDN